jgi:cytochrome c oxidase subunit 2
MPSYAGQLSDDHINQLIAFIKTLDGSKPVAAAPAVTAAAAPDPALAAMSPVERGKKWYNEKLCVTCHSLDGTKLVGPTFLGIYGRQQKMVDGTVVTTDDAYLKSSILNPMAQVVEGYPPAMPGGLLTEEQIPDLIEFLKTVK